MTLEAYDPDRLDALAWRAFDLSARLRVLARTCRDEPLTKVELHDRKTLEWFEKLETWACGAEADVDRQIKLARAAKAARAARKGR